MSHTTIYPSFWDVAAWDVQTGDVIICHGAYAIVTARTVHEPFTHPQSPIYNNLQALELRTDDGSSRWFGVREASTIKCNVYGRPAGAL